MVMRPDRQFRLWVLRNFVLTQSILSFMNLFFIGIYINILTIKIYTNPINKLIEVMWSLGSWNILLIMGFGSIILHIYLLSIPQDTVKRIGSKLIESVLEAACSSLIYHRKDLSIRAIVTLVDKSSRTRTTRFSYNIRPDPERTATFPIEFGVTGEAIINRMVVAKELPEDHMNTYPLKIRRLILPELKCVLAAPIYLPEDREAGPIGVLAFDSTDPISKSNFDSRQAKDVAQAWADIVGTILGQTYILKLYHYAKC